MNTQVYRDMVVALESKPDSINFGPGALFHTFMLAIGAAKALDQVKRAIYYGKDVDVQLAAGALNTVTQAAQSLTFSLTTGRYRDSKDFDFFQQLPADVREKFKVENLNIRALHAVLGGFTESGELFEALTPQFAGNPVDPVNLLEELGDKAWYDEVLLDVLGATREQRDERNFAKLADKFQGRYKDGKFSEAAAVNRDVEAERELLEKA